MDMVDDDELSLTQINLEAKADDQQTDLERNELECRIESESVSVASTTAATVASSALGVPVLPTEFFAQAQVDPYIERYGCQICLGYFPLAEMYPLEKCGHHFCKECIASYVRFKVLNGNVYPKCCFDPESPIQFVKFLRKETGEEDTVPADMNMRTRSNDSSGPGHADSVAQIRPQPCEIFISHADILRILEDDMDALEKYFRFKYCAENKDARECPTCHVFYIGNPTVTPKIVCTKCDRTFCFFHANAHDFNKFPTCAEYEASVAEELKDSIDLIHSVAKRCPQCQMMVMKSGGCNHMKCKCGVAFCWLCGKQIDDTVFPAHYQWWNPSGCTNLQMNDEVEPSSCMRAVAYFAAVVQMILFGPITFASALVSSCLCAPCLVAKLQRDRPASLRAYVQENASACMTGWGVFWMILILVIPLVLAVGGAVAAIAVGICAALSPCYCVYRIARRKSPLPSWLSRCVYDVSVRPVRTWYYNYRYRRMMQDRRRGVSTDNDADLEANGVVLDVVVSDAGDEVDTADHKNRDDHVDTEEAKADEQDDSLELWRLYSTAL